LGGALVFSIGVAGDGWGASRMEYEHPRDSSESAFLSK
jgi:hypothetical protein